MAFVNPSEEAIAGLLARTNTIAVVGLSPDPNRPSYGVAMAMQRWGYRMFPVNPTAAVILNEPTFPSLTALVESHGIPDLVDVFRRPEHVASVIDECLSLGVRAIWLQEGVIDEAAALKAEAAGVTVVMDRCLLKVRAALAQAIEEGDEGDDQPTEPIRPDPLDLAEDSALP